MIAEAGLLSLWLRVSPLQPDFEVMWSSLSLVAPLGAADPEAQQAAAQYLQELQKKGYDRSRQGIWLQSPDRLLLNHQGLLPLPGASLTKIATSLAAIATWPLDHRFETWVGMRGKVHRGILEGDLIIQGGGDPLFTVEEGIALAYTLDRLGIRRVTGDLLVVGDFSMNFELDPLRSGRVLQQSFNADLWTETVREELELPDVAFGTRKPRLVIQGAVKLGHGIDLRSPVADARLLRLVRHRSLPLHQLIRVINVYSSNEMSEVLAKAMGGVQAVMAKAANLAGTPPDELRLINGSGLGVENELSARTASAMLIAIQYHLQRWKVAQGQVELTIADLFPVSGRDLGTLEDRQVPVHGIVKTGTLNTVSALAGVVPTRDRGLVWFAIINRGDDIEALRQQQDRFLQDLVNRWGQPIEPPPTVRPRAARRIDPLGDETRNEILTRFE